MNRATANGFAPQGSVWQIHRKGSGIGVCSLRYMPCFSPSSSSQNPEVEIKLHMVDVSVTAQHPGSASFSAIHLRQEERGQWQISL
jgi:hypothetical protein